MDKRTRLGRGLSSLLNPTASESEQIDLSDIAGQLPPTAGSPSEMFHVELSKIRANPNQPRKVFTEQTLAALAASMKLAGVIQPILVRPVDDGYEVIAGERRFRAALLAGLATVPVIIRSVDVVEQSQLALIENIHREDLNPIDRAMAYREMARQLNLTHADIAARLGEERSSIANYMRLLDLPDGCRTLVRQGSLSVGHAKLLCAIDDPNEIDRLAQQAIAQQLSVRALETLIKNRGESNPPTTKKPHSPHLADLEKQISRDLQMRAEVKQGRKGTRGKLVIHYASLDQFDELMNRLSIKIE